MYLVSGIVYTFLIPTVFLVASRVFKNQRFGLLSAMFLLVNPDVLMNGMSALARSAVSYLLVLAIYLLMNYNFRKAILSIILAFALILYHTASMPFIMVLFLLIYAGQRFYRLDREQWVIRGNYLLMLTAATLTYWIYCALPLFYAILSNVIVPPPPVGAISKIAFPLNELFNYLQYTPVLLFVFFGMIWAMFSKRFNSLARLFLVCAIIMVPFSFPGPILLLTKFASNFSLDRFNIYTFLFTAMAAGAGLAGIYYKSRRFGRALTLVIVCLLAFLAVSNDFDASDHPLVKRTFYNFYLTQSEYVGIRQLASTSNTDDLLTDYVAFNYLHFSSEFGDKADILETDQNGTTFLRGSPEDVLCIREGELEARPLDFLVSPTGEYIDKPSMYTGLSYFYSDALLYQTLSNYDKIYDDRDVAAYI